jgi:hypothetical protein
MVSLMKKLLDKRDDRLFFAGIIIIAANSGGAWTPRSPGCQTGRGRSMGWVARGARARPK